MLEVLPDGDLFTHFHFRRFHDQINLKNAFLKCATRSTVPDP